MKRFVRFVVFLFVLLGSTQAQITISNPQIDFPAFLKDAEKTQPVREKRRLSEDEFLEKMREPGVLLLDARSPASYNLRHLRGAVNLSLPDFTAPALKKIVPRKDTPILIYCNNNFAGSPESFALKVRAASLNIYTFTSLQSYGYTNVYELGPYLNTKTTKLPFAGDEVSND